MASKSSMKGFYKQQKKSGGVTKPSKSKPTKPKDAAAIGSNVTQPSALISHGSLDLKGHIIDYGLGVLNSFLYNSYSVAIVCLAIAKFADNYDQNEEVLRQFDMNMVYGPCLGMNRLDRLERAKKLGMNPPTDVERLLRSNKVRNECLWNGCV
ncbi:hypothetical protein RDI58_023352 [Solanum bulbocastanum]|uniref:Uncharacterized protein n=1 Tax=Solanum bulbocastanum TaxID=147425 RepID=A0AAN8Y968_SOLBU